MFVHVGAHDAHLVRAQSALVDDVHLLHRRAEFAQTMQRFAVRQPAVRRVHLTRGRTEQEAEEMGLARGEFRERQLIGAPKKQC